MDNLQIILQIIGTVAIAALGYGLAFFGGLGNALPVYLIGMGLYLFGVFATAFTILVSVFGADPSNPVVYGISVFVAFFIGIWHYNKLFGRKKS